MVSPATTVALMRFPPMMTVLMLCGFGFQASAVAAATVHHRHRVKPLFGMRPSSRRGALSVDDHRRLATRSAALLRTTAPPASASASAAAAASPHFQLRGGGSSDSEPTSEGSNEANVDDENDEERYSRQVYTLGARAHQLVRSCTVLIDGPLKSGLVYETGKNLALSGVGGIVLLTDDDDDDGDGPYHEPTLDDLGNAYRNAARSELGMDAGDDDLELVMEYIRRLNPSVQVTSMTRSEFLAMRKDAAGSPTADDDDDDVDDDADDDDRLGANPVLLCVDRPQSTQLLLNAACHHGADIIPFVSVETAGVYSRTFCDFGPEFEVVDEDGETPKDTLLDRIERLEEEGDDDGNDGVLVVHCLEDERHDVSRGDRIAFQKGGSSSDGGELGECEVINVKNPQCFTVRRFCGGDGGGGGGSTMPQSGGGDKDAFVKRVNRNANSFGRVKVPRTVPFLPLSDALAGQRDPTQDLFAASDLDKSFDATRRCAIMSSFASLDDFVREFGRLPSASDGQDLKKFQEIAKRCRSSSIEGEEDMQQTTAGKDWSAIVKSFGRCSRAKLAPVQALCGALGAQETLKAASGLYNPIKQFLLYDCDEILPPRRGRRKVAGDGDDEDSYSSKSTYGAAGQVYVLGESLTKKLASRKIFVVGSGAIGCEILKNLSAMGAGTRKSKGGAVVLTDMDTIEKSNLSRQLLFRDSDVGKFKSAAAQEAVRRFNSRINIEAHTSKVGDDSEGGAFDDSFWSDGVDIILNALDNVEARLYMDSQCVAHQKGLIDAGTLGSKGNVQVVVPGQSESYGSSADPPEPAIPVCTLKNFPYDISHTIQWGRDLFDGLFNRRPSQVNDNVDALSTESVTKFAKTLLHNLGDDAALEAAEEIGEDFMPAPDADEESDIDFVGRVKESSIEWAIQLAHKMFCVAVQDLLRQHPPDSVDEDGEPFWTGTRRVPKILTFDTTPSTDAVPAEQTVVNEHVIDFVRFAARLRMEVYLSKTIQSEGAETQVSVDDAVEALSKFRSLAKVDVAPSAEDDTGSASNDLLSEVVELLDGAKVWSEQMHSLHSIEFEKDDDTNGHVAFVTAASNLRALCYGIKPVDAMETRRVAGRIVPAMITTTGFVSALSCIELLKLLQKAPLQAHRNAFINLALPFFAFTSPMPAEEMQGLNGQSYTIWDRMVMREGKKSSQGGGMKLSRFLKQMKKQIASDETEGAEVATVSYGPYMLYANFLHEDDDAVLRQSMWDLVKEAIISGDDIDDEFYAPDSDAEGKEEAELTKEQVEEVRQLERRSFLDFSVIVEDFETGEEIELPPVRLMRWKEEKCEAD